MFLIFLSEDFNVSLRGLRQSLAEAKSELGSIFDYLRELKLFVFILMAFIMGIASFTLFYALSLLVIEKRKDLRTLLAMGMTPKQMMQIFLSVGLFISFSGAVVGMGLGFALGWIQQTFGIIPLGIPNALIDAYPIQMEWFDFLMTALVVMVITFLASIIPARKAVQLTFDQKINLPKAD